VSAAAAKSLKFMFGMQTMSQSAACQDICLDERVSSWVKSFGTGKSNLVSCGLRFEPRNGELWPSFLGSLHPHTTATVYEEAESFISIHCCINAERLNVLKYTAAICQSVRAQETNKQQFICTEKNRCERSALKK